MTTTYAPNPRFYAPTDPLHENLTEEIETARKHLAKAIEAKGEDYVYITDTEANPSAARECLYLRYECIDYDDEEGVQYVGPKGPSCIVGHVLVYGGIPPYKITEREGENAAAACKALGAFTSPIVIEALNRAQSKQDHANGYTWGEAVEEFEAYIAERTVQTDA